MSAELPHGIPLTPTEELTAADGTVWTVYVEGTPPVRRWRLLSQTLLPGRRLRFDSATDSRVSGTVPAGSPFLGERRLLELLTASVPLAAAEAPAPVPTLRERWIAAARDRWMAIRAGVLDAVRRLLAVIRAPRLGSAMGHHR